MAKRKAIAHLKNSIRVVKLKPQKKSLRGLASIKPKSKNEEYSEEDIDRMYIEAELYEKEVNDLDEVISSDIIPGERHGVFQDSCRLNC
jgi:hypothetical protein